MWDTLKETHFAEDTVKRPLVCLSLLALASCQNGLGPVADISGTWTGSRVEYSLTLDLVQQGASVNGTGHSSSNIYPPTTEYSVAGTYSFPHVALTLTSNDTVVSHVTGVVLDAHHMIRVQAFSDFSDTLTLTRQ